MPRFLVERGLGHLTDDELPTAAEESTRVRERDFPQIGWEHSHVVRDDDGLRALCIYSAPDAGTLRDYSRRAGLPVDRIGEIHADLVPDPG